MNHKMSFYLLIALLLIGASCKSEGKSPNKNTAEDLIEKQSEAKLPSADTKEMMEVQSEKSEPKAQEEATAKPEKSAKAEKKAKKPKMDKGIAIEMGLDDTETEEQTKPHNEASTPDPTEAIKEVEETTKEDVEIKDRKPIKPKKIEKPVGFPSHNKLNALLQKYVSASGTVNYAGLKKEEAVLDEYLSILETQTPETTWNRDIELTYWINAYNAYTLKLILQNYPVSSITNLHNGKPWDVKWINIDGKSLSLNNIENDIIRPKFNEPRIHFAVNCAAKSCPPLLNAAYYAKTLDTQLESQTKKFINNPEYNTLGKSEIKVSKIFDWYKSDFGDIVAFVMRYADTTVKPDATVTFQEYDWRLNGE